MKELKPRKWYVFYANCHCGGYWTTRRRHIRSGCFPRCDFCRRQLGDFDWKFYGEYVATTQGEAIKRANADALEANRKRMEKSGHTKRHS